MKEADAENYFSFDLANLAPKTTLSLISGQEDFLFNKLIFHLRDLYPNLPSDGVSSGAGLLMRKLTANSYSFRFILANSYKKEKSLRIRENVWAFLEAQGIGESSSACISTNWDDVLWRNGRIKNIGHLHGVPFWPAASFFRLKRLINEFYVEF